MTNFKSELIVNIEAANFAGLGSYDHADLRMAIADGIHKAAGWDVFVVIRDASFNGFEAHGPWSEAQDEAAWAAVVEAVRAVRTRAYELGALQEVA